MTKNKAFTLIAIFSFLFFVFGVLCGVYIEWKNEKFWQSVILEPDRIEQFEDITDEAIELEKRLDALKLELDAYWIPESSPDIERLSRER